MRKGRLILAMFLIIFSIYGAIAQNSINTLTVDSKTYYFYEQKEWNKLIETGKESLRHGIDFYYLRYRMGIAYYELKNYRKAVGFFKKVIEETPEDKIAAEYLYYSYLFSGMYDDARLFGRELPVDLKKKLNIDYERLLINSAGAEFKYYSIDNYESSIKNGDYLNQKILKYLWYANVNITSYTKGKFTLFQGFSYLRGKNKVFDITYYESAFNENIRQFQYYISGNWNLSKGRYIKAAFHYITTKFEAENPDFSTGRGQMPGNKVKYFYSKKTNGFAGFLKFGKNISNFDLRASLTLSYLNSGTQFLPGIGVTYFPFGNTDFYLGADMLYRFTNADSSFNPGLIIKSNLGILLFKKLRIEPFMLYGQAKNLVDEDAFVVYNSINVINYWYGINLNTLIMKNRLLLYFTWQQYSLTNSYLLNSFEKKTDFNMGTFLGGVKFRF